MSDIILTIESVKGKRVPPGRSKELIDLIHETLEDTLGYDIDIATIDETGGTGFLIDSMDSKDVMLAIVKGMEMDVSFIVFPPSHIKDEDKVEYLKRVAKDTPSPGSQHGDVSIRDGGLYEKGERIWGGTSKEEALTIFQMMKKELESD